VKVSHVEFHNKPLLELGDDDRWTVYRDLMVKVFHSDAAPDWITVPAGFATDLASVPRIPWAFWLFGDRARRAGIVHDWLYSQGGSRSYADDVFLACMRTEVGDSLSRRAMWAGVRAFGWMFHRKDQRPERVPEPVQWPDA
jgi:hypothetical protein